MYIVSNEGNLWLPALITMIHPFPVIIVVNIFVEMLLIALQYCFFKTYFVVALASPSTSSLLFEINSGNLQCGIRDSYDPVRAQ